MGADYWSERRNWESAGGRTCGRGNEFNFDGAANFAALIVADRIEVVRELTALPSGETAT